jgi:DNA-binding transcriptional LysR family regulator
LNGLYQRYPQLRVDIAADDRMADMVREGIDIAIRTGTPNSDTLVARQIGEYCRSLYAAPSYLARCGIPQHPDDLAQHYLIASSVSPTRNRWPLKPGSGQKSPGVLEVTGHTRTDNSAVMLSLVQQGVGIGQLTDLLARPLVASGALVPLLLEHFERPRVPVFAVMLQERHRLPKVRACIDYWAQWLAQMTQDLSTKPG